MDKFLIRDYKKGDFEQIIELWQETELGNARRGDNAEIIEHSIQLGGKFIILENTETKEIVGTSWITFDGRRLHLHHIGIKPTYQNKGYGKLITLESLKFAKNKGYQIKLEVHQTNTKAISIYKNLGFSFLGDYDVYIVRNLESIKV